MKIERAANIPADAGGWDADAIVVGVYGEELGPAAEQLDSILGGGIKRLVDTEEIRGTAGEVTKLLGHAGLPAIIVLGLGTGSELGPIAVRRAAGAASMSVASRQRKVVEFRLDLPTKLQMPGLLGAASGCVGNDLYRNKKKLHPFDVLRWDGLDEESLTRGAVVAAATETTRHLVNRPANLVFPESFAEEAAEMAQSGGLEVEVWDQKRLEQERCGALLAVARGSAKSPRLVTLRHRGAGADAPWLALVGKGVTFDSGGLSLKPTESMKAMKCDMAGAATVFGAMQAIAELKLPANVMGLCGLVENMVSADAYRLGDVLTARNGRTIEVLNTDAEGRLVLADVLDVALEKGAAKLVDLATLTGACVVALGHEAAGIMTNDVTWCDTLRRAAEAAGERVWELPMYPEFAEEIKSDIADIKNVGAGRWGGAITAAKFLEEFVGGKPWTHIDIAGPAFINSSVSWQSPGGTGAMVATLVELATQWGEGK